ncbi:uncharacterized protein LOC117112738 [Anneissia japonica]|uniref:uncharacterized protein LOC117112738 n=1 Tax=Anneissia japonica TaxID=1529436 RepID=UPI001425B983|nr:uncharacterized protein LOC117112738 [Anneissia japonica]
MSGQTDVTRVMLWCPPRSLSTAFERCISGGTKHKVKVYHELFTTSYHIGPEKQISYPIPLPFGGVLEETYSYQWVKDCLEGPSDADFVFAKDLAYAVEGRYEYLPEDFIHTFLIRHPAKVFLSYETLMAKFPASLIGMSFTDILPKGYVFKELYELFHYIQTTLGQKAIVIDADDLLQKPVQTLEKYCSEIGMKYSDGMLNWGKFQPDDWTFSENMMWINRIIGQYDKAFSTKKLLGSTDKPIDVSSVSETVMQAVKYCIPYYEKMYTHSLKPYMKS